MQKLVKGATKPKATAPKAKYVEPILASTYEGGHDFEAVMDALTRVLGTRNGTWPSIYKALILIHIMIREGSEDVTLRYLARHPRMLDIEDHIHRAPVMGRYARYLFTRGQQFKDTKVDHVRYRTRQGLSRLNSLTVQKGLMRECGSVLIQIEALMKCQFQEQEIINDDVLLMAFRLLVNDSLSLFQVLNEGVINLLEHFFELSKPDAEEALNIYHGFKRVTAKVISYLRVAKDLEFKTMLHVPNIKHAPTSLVSSLEMYINDPQFDANRQQYLAEKQADQLKRTRSQTRPSEQDAKSEPKRAVSAPHGISRNTSAPSQYQQIHQQVQQLQQVPVQSLQMPPSHVQSSQIQPIVQQNQLDPNLTSNPFWKTQQEASHIQKADGQAQIQMQQLKQLQMAQIGHQERIRQQIQQLEQQQQVMQTQQAQQVSVPQFMAPHTTDNFDFGLQQAPYTQQIPQQQFTQAQQVYPTPNIQQVQPQVQSQVQPQVTGPLQTTGINPFKQTMAPTPDSTNPFKSPMAIDSPFAAFDSIGTQMQPSLIDFSNPQSYQLTGNNTTGKNPFR